MSILAKYIISDTHFGDYDLQTKRGVITFERTQFETIMDHDLAVSKMIEEIAKKVKPGDEFWHLGDFGRLDWLFEIQRFKDIGVVTHLILGNHDAAADIPEFEKYFQYVHQYPVYLSKKLVLSHEPVGVWDSVINVHGHLHGSIIDKPNYINASIHVANYKPITDKHIANAYTKIPKWCMRFLYEPYANMYKFIQQKEDVIMNKDGCIDLSASRLLMKLHSDARKKEWEDKINAPGGLYYPYTGYDPYTGGL